MAKKIKTLAQLKAHPRVQEAWYEEENGYFAVLKPGWHCDRTDCHTCREDTITELAEALDATQQCDCDPENAGHPKPVTA